VVDWNGTFGIATSRRFGGHRNLRAITSSRKRNSSIR